MNDQARRAAGLVVFLLAGLFVVAAQAGEILDRVRSSGVLRCGLVTPAAGLAIQNADGEWSGFDIDLCRAVAAAIGPEAKLEVAVLEPDEAQARLAEQAVDMLARDRASGLPGAISGTVFATSSLIDAQGLLVPLATSRGNALGLDGRSICLLAEGPYGDNLARFARGAGIAFDPMPLASETLMAEAFFGGGCAALSAGRLTMARLRAKAVSAGGKYEILDEVLSREQMGPFVPVGDRVWLNLVRWTVFALISAEELGIASDSAADMRRSSVDPRVLRLLGVEGGLGQGLGLADDWAFKAITAVGNYGEIYARHLGPATPLALERGPNALWSDGGLLVAPPFH